VSESVTNFTVLTICGRIECLDLGDSIGLLAKGKLIHVVPKANCNEFDCIRARVDFCFGNGGMYDLDYYVKEEFPGRRP
jgi:hypothetical protein